MDKKIKLYGLFNITKKQYLYGQCAAAIALVFLWTWTIAGDFNDFLFGYGTIILAITTLAEIIETYITLMKFRNNKHEQTSRR